MLAERPCELRDSDHRYVDLTNGTEGGLDRVQLQASRAGRPMKPDR